MKNLPPLVPDPVIDAYKKDVDRTMLRENLKLSYEARLRQLQSMEDLREEFHSKLSWKKKAVP
jgi:hypothetical protein